jgi:hypothetical protein
LAGLGQANSCSARNDRSDSDTAQTPTGETSIHDDRERTDAEEILFARFREQKRAG